MEYIFKPLEMSDTSFSCPEDKIDRLASLYEHNPKGHPRLLEIPFLNTKMASGGGLFSTMSDYHNFCHMLLYKGNLRGSD